MKRLIEYLTESSKTYPFKIGVAGDIPEGFNDSLRSAMEKFSVASISVGKKTPIQQHPLDFPQMENTEVTYWDVEIKYPTTDAVLQEYLSNTCTISKSKIVVRNANSPLEKQSPDQLDTDTTYEVLLTKEDLGGTSAQSSVGNNRVMDLLKELETARKERSSNQDGFKAEAMKKEPQSTKSVMGS